MQSCTGATGQTASKRPTLRQGSRGADVAYLQQRLSAGGYQPGAEDGIFGGKTLAAVMAFQKDHGLTVDGIVGVKTWSILAR